MKKLLYFLCFILSFNVAICFQSSDLREVSEITKNVKLYHSLTEAFRKNCKDSGILPEVIIASNAVSFTNNEAIRNCGNINSIESLDKVGVKLDLSDDLKNINDIYEKLFGAKVEQVVTFSNFSIFKIVDSEVVDKNNQSTNLAETVTQKQSNLFANFYISCIGAKACYFTLVSSVTNMKDNKYLNLSSVLINTSFQDRDYNRDFFPYFFGEGDASKEIYNRFHQYADVLRKAIATNISTNRIKE